MVTKLGLYTLQDDTIAKMKTKIEETREKNIELGFGLCRMKFINTLKPGNDCSGNECSIAQLPECQNGVYIGGYHTHPSGPAEPSIADLRGAYINDIECVGSPEENAIRCFIRNSYRKPQEENDIISKFKEVEENSPKLVGKEQYEIWKNARDEILNKHFQVVDVK